MLDHNCLLIDHNINAQRLALPMPSPRSANHFHQVQWHDWADLTWLNRLGEQRHSEVDGGLLTSFTKDVPPALGADGSNMNQWAADLLCEKLTCLTVLAYFAGDALSRQITSDHHRIVQRFATYLEALGKDDVLLHNVIRR
ncbi:TPA: hypothetical protein ACXJTM_000537 [Stenotrophomonas maltophilia]